MDRVGPRPPATRKWKTLEPVPLGAGGQSRRAGRWARRRGGPEIMAATHAGLTTEAFTRPSSKWLATARHPRDRPYTDLVSPADAGAAGLLRANQFKTFIVSGGGIDFMRPWTESASTAYRPNRSSDRRVSRSTTWRPRQAGPAQRPRLPVIDDGPGKPKASTASSGDVRSLPSTSDGDQQMLEWTAAGGGTRFMGLVHHTDAVRGICLRPTIRRSAVLDKAWDRRIRRRWTIADMKNDWRVIYPFELK